GFFTRVLIAPGLWTQYLTTREPTDDQIEVAVTALRRVQDLEEEGEPSLLEPSPEAEVSTIPSAP
ncbi:MAG: hypothetical protein C4336_08945, partial [Armatimonadota bacterium]